LHLPSLSFRIFEITSDNLHALAASPPSLIRFA
jgi:hypothetical protein